MTPARLRWGLLLVQVGALILLVNLEVIDLNFIPLLLSAIPFFLILVGIEKIFTRSRAEVISYLAVLSIFVGGIVIAVIGTGDSDYGSFFHRTDYHQKYDPSIKELQALIRIGDGDLTVRDVTDDLFHAKFAKYTSKPKIRYDTENQIGKLRLQKRSHALWGNVVRINVDDRADWTLYFSGVIPLDLECYGDNCDVALNLASTPLKRLKIDADESDLYLKIGEIEPLVSLDLRGNHSDLRLRLPSGASVTIKADEFASYLEQIGFVKENGFFKFSDSDSSSAEIEIELDRRFDDLKIEFY